MSTRSESLPHYALINALWISLTVQDTALMTIAIPAAIAALAPRNHVAVLAALASISNVAAMLVPPVAGWLSDRSHKRGGSRRIWILAGCAADVAALVALAYVHNLILFSAIFVFAVAAANVAIAAYQAMIPEVVPRAAWGAASGMRGAATLVGTVIGLGVAGWISNVGIVFIATAMLIALGTLTIFAAQERGPIQHDRVEVTRWHDFIVVFIARSFIFFGLSLLMTFVLYFFSDILKVHDAPAGTASIGIFSLLGAIASSVGFGIASDRIPRKHLVAACGVPMAIAAIGFAVAPSPTYMFAFAALFGVGLGGVLSVGWALAIDSLPQLSDIARDLGIWGIATNLPNIIAPAVGGWILALFADSKAGYQTIFALAGVSFALGSLTIIRVGVAPLSSLLTMPVWIAAITSVYWYTGLKHRVRGWGHLPRNPSGSLVAINHQHQVDATTLVSRIGLRSSWRHPVFSSSGRRLYEPGFFAVEFPWLRWIARDWRLAPLFSILGLMPIENMLYARPAASLAHDIESVRGPLPIAEIFPPDAPAWFPPGTLTSDLRNAANFATAQRMVRIKDVKEPYRADLLRVTRDRTENDVRAMERVVRRGGIYFLTPEGTYSNDGLLCPMRALLPRLHAEAKATYVMGVSYDTFRDRRLSLLYRLVPVRNFAHFTDELAAARPVTVTQLMAAWLASHDAPFTEADAVAAARARLADVPSMLFVDPELQRDPARVTRIALREMVRAGMLAHTGTHYAIARRTDPRFPNVPDAVSYHARFYAQSVEAATRLSEARG
jgi:MFS family permease